MRTHESEYLCKKKVFCKTKILYASTWNDLQAILQEGILLGSVCYVTWPPANVSLSVFLYVW